MLKLSSHVDECEPLDAGMNMMEVWVAWAEVLFQLLTDPAGAMQRPEVGRSRSILSNPY